MNSQGPLAITPRLARPSAKVATVVAPSTFPSPHTRPSARERLTRDVRKSADNSFAAKRHACRWPKQKPAQASLLPFQVSGSAQRMKGDIAEARCQALALHALHLSGHLLLQGQLPPLQKEA